MSVFTSTLENGYHRPGTMGMIGLMLAAAICMALPMAAIILPMLSNLRATFVPTEGIPGWLLKIDAAAALIALGLSFSRDMWAKPFFPSFLIMSLACCAGVTGGAAISSMFFGASFNPGPLLFLLAAGLVMMLAAALPAELKLRSAFAGLGAYCAMSVMWFFMEFEYPPFVTCVAILGFGCLFRPRFVLAVCALAPLGLIGGTAAASGFTTWNVLRK